MRAHTAGVEVGKVFLLKGAPWLDELRSELLAFPHGRHDDQVDALSQLMTWDEERRIPKRRSTASGRSEAPEGGSRVGAF